jgi:hypothetical protein
VVKLGQALNQILHLSAHLGNVSHVKAELGTVRDHFFHITERILLMVANLND